MKEFERKFSTPGEVANRILSTVLKIPGIDKRLENKLREEFLQASMEVGDSTELLSRLAKILAENGIRLTDAEINKLTEP
jgi:hypothetical protein